MFLSICFRGGLGNQLFQYATGRSLALTKKIPFLFFANDSFQLDRVPCRSFRLHHFGVRGQVYGNVHLKNVFTPKARLNQLAQRIGLHREITESGFVVQKNLEDKTAFFSTLRGFWQSPRYFDGIRQQLLKELVPLYLPAYPGWLQKDNTVAIHVRRTDYLQEPRYGFLGREYYQRAIAYLEQSVANPFFIFFSDDIAWCRAEFGSGFHYVTEADWQEDYLQLHLMARCRHQVIANSSFSWWAAWLNANDDKIVIRPEQPFRDAALLYEDHYPHEWVAIKNLE